MHHPFYDVFKFTDIAGPRVTEKHIHSPIRNPQGAASEGGDEVIEEMVDQKRDVRTAFAQGRHVESEDVQAIVEILAEGVLTDGVFKIAVRGGEHPHVDEAGVFASHAGHFAVLEQTEQADLRFKGHLPDFIKKNGPVVRQLKFAGLPKAARARKRAFIIAEKLALHEVARQCPAVHHDERRVGPPAPVVDRLREKLLARAAFPEDEGGHIALGRHAGHAYDLLRGGRVADNVIESIDGLGPGDAHGGFLDPFGLAQGQHPAFPRFQAGERKHTVERTALELEERFLIAELAAFREDRPDDVAGKDDVLNIAVHSVRRQVEHGLRLVVQRPYRAVAFQHDHPFIQHFNDGLLFLKEQPQAELFRDGVGRRFHHPPGMVMVQGARERHIEHADDGVPAVPDGGRRAEPAVERAAVMFRSQRLHRRMFHEARPDGIGPRGAFRREVARCEVRDGITAGIVPERVQDDPLRIGQGNETARSADGVIQLFHDAFGHRHKILVLIEQLFQRGGAEGHFGGVVRPDPLKAAALP